MKKPLVSVKTFGLTKITSGISVSINSNGILVSSEVKIVYFFSVSFSRLRSIPSIIGIS